jgi:hypothetical protein
MVSPRHRSIKATIKATVAFQRTLFDLPAEIRCRIFVVVVALDQVDIKLDLSDIQGVRLFEPKSTLEMRLACKQMSREPEYQAECMRCDYKERFCDLRAEYRYSWRMRRMVLDNGYCREFDLSTFANVRSITCNEGRIYEMKGWTMTNSAMKKCSNASWSLRKLVSMPSCCISCLPGFKKLFRTLGSNRSSTWTSISPSMNHSLLKSIPGVKDRTTQFSTCGFRGATTGKNGLYLTCCPKFDVQGNS